MYQPGVFICKAQHFASVRAAGQDPLVSLFLPALQLSPGLLLWHLFACCHIGRVLSLGWFGPSPAFPTAILLTLPAPEEHPVSPSPYVSLSVFRFKVS